MPGMKLTLKDTLRHGVPEVAGCRTTCGPSDGKEEKGVFVRPSAQGSVRVGSEHLRPLAAHGIWCPVAGLNLETGHLSRHNIAEISLNMMLNKPTEGRKL